MNKEIVVARYKENIDWVEQIDKNIVVSVYDKGGEPKQYYNNLILPNIGNEAHTYLWHIVRVYNGGLADITYFLQGRYDDHSPDALNFICNDPMEVPFKTMCAWADATADHWGNPHHNGLPVGDYYRRIFNEELDHIIVFGAGSQFAVRKEAILSKPLEFWQKLLIMSEDTHTFPYVAERLWKYFFTKTLQ